MKIIKGYWGNKNEEETQEKTIKEHLKNYEIKKVFVGFKEIKDFKISIDKDNRFLLRYALRKNGSLKYYFNLLAKSIVVNKNVLVCLWDYNWKDYKANQLNKKTLKILNLKQ